MSLSALSGSKREAFLQTEGAFASPGGEERRAAGPFFPFSKKTSSHGGLLSDADEQRLKFRTGHEGVSEQQITERFCVHEFNNSEPTRHPAEGRRRVHLWWSPAETFCSSLLEAELH